MAEIGGGPGGVSHLVYEINKFMVTTTKCLTSFGESMYLLGMFLQALAQGSIIN